MWLVTRAPLVPIGSLEIWTRDLLPLAHDLADGRGLRDARRLVVAAALARVAPAAGASVAAAAAAAAALVAAAAPVAVAAGASVVVATAAALAVVVATAAALAVVVATAAALTVAVAAAALATLTRGAFTSDRGLARRALRQRARRLGRLRGDSALDLGARLARAP